MSKKFTSEKQMPEASAQFVWPSFGRKEYSSPLFEHLKEAETKILREAKEKAQFIEKEAYEKGFAQGEKDGRELGQKRIETVVGQIRELADELQNQRERFYRLCEKEMLQLVLGIARKIIHREPQLAKESDVVVVVLLDAACEGLALFL